jgi:hypothetical protein
MTKIIFTFIFLCILICQSKAQNKINDKTQFHSQSFGIQGGLSLLENPFVLYPIVNLSYSKTIIGHNRHQLAIFPQLGLIILPAIEKYPLHQPLIYNFISSA